MKNIFDGRKIVIATMHEKEKIIGPLLENTFGMIPVLAKHFNTDLYGTFSGDIQRQGSQLEAARRKAIAALTLMDADLVVASEGSFGPHPSVPFFQSNLELIVLIDKKI